ncbi:uncharacterized protein LOC129889343 [Solanum dulcamara]|uniref:uncharacterized protein LOC129889343 n=1 Tax=Solanum dulcamara TaxID=45834 RepID=UPI00248506CB|nr:uncharacterized protein LOC129889343 [Solanum dulcamara]
MSRSSDTLLCVFMLLGICIGIVKATATKPKIDNNKELFSTSSILSWWHRHHLPSIRWGLRRHPKKPLPPTHLAPSPSPAVSPSHMASSPTHAAPSLVDDVVSPPHTAPSWASAPTTSCIKMDDCLSDLITSVFKRKISLSTQCCKVAPTISDDCFYRRFVHSKRVPFFLVKVRNYCSHHQG